MNCSVNDQVLVPSPGSRDTGTEMPLGMELTTRLRQAAAAFYETEGGCHGPDHTDRVHVTAIYIGRAMGARLDILSGAAILHDIGRREEYASRGRLCHAARGAELARVILQDLNFKTDDLERICHCIATHRFRDTLAPVSLEAKILFDADKLDSIGAVGIGRAFLFAGQLGARLHNQESDINTTSAYSTDDTAYREFRVKLCKIRDRMQTRIGRRLADDRHRFMQDFFDRLENEINGGVPDAKGC